MQTPRECLRCHEIKTINSRGMCRPCYDAVRKDGTVNRYARVLEKTEPAWRNHVVDERSGCWIVPQEMRDADRRDAFVEWAGRPVKYGHFVESDRFRCRNLNRCTSPLHLIEMTAYERELYANV